MDENKIILEHLAHGVASRVVLEIDADGALTFDQHGYYLYLFNDQAEQLRAALAGDDGAAELREALEKARPLLEAYADFAREQPKTLATIQFRKDLRAVLEQVDAALAMAKGAKGE